MTALEVDGDSADGAPLPASGLWKTLGRLGVRVDLVRGDTLSADEGWLIESGAVALFSEIDHRLTCVDLLTAGDVVGLAEAISAHPSPVRMIVVMEGVARRFSRAVVRQEWGTNAFFRSAVIVELQAAAEAARGFSACERRHTADQRLGSLLLRLSASRPNSLIAMSQEAAAGLLNVRRTTVTASVARLEALGAITGRRGGVEIADRARLTRFACSCHLAAYRHGLAIHSVQDDQATSGPPVLRSI